MANVPVQFSVDFVCKYDKCAPKLSLLSSPHFFASDECYFFDSPNSFFVVIGGLRQAIHQNLISMASKIMQLDDGMALMNQARFLAWVR